jgi:hypothetical protein
MIIKLAPAHSVMWGICAVVSAGILARTFSLLFGSGLERLGSWLEVCFGYLSATSNEQRVTSNE